MMLPKKWSPQTLKYLFIGGSIIAAMIVIGVVYKLWSDSEYESRMIEEKKKEAQRRAALAQAQAREEKTPKSPYPIRGMKGAVTVTQLSPTEVTLHNAMIMDSQTQQPTVAYEIPQLMLEDNCRDLYHQGLRGSSLQKPVGWHWDPSRRVCTHYLSEGEVYVVPGGDEVNV